MVYKLHVLHVFAAEAREAVTLDSKVLRGTNKPALLTVSVHSEIKLMAYIIIFLELFEPISNNGRTPQFND